MVIINLKGGLGNQLFQYATALAISKNRRQDLVFDVYSFENDPYGRSFALKPFKADGLICSKEEVSSVLKLSVMDRIINFLKPKKNKRYFSLGDLEVDLSILEANPKDQYLNGYFAHPQYFESCRAEILQKVALKGEYRTELFEQKVKWIQENKFISIHIRRADYISDHAASQLFESLDKEYYYRGISYFEENKDKSQKFLFFSDDLDWVKSQFKDLNGAHFIEEPELYKDYYDLLFMAACEHNIIANSTFSWWGAWLNSNPNKVVLAPKKWYRDPVYQSFYKSSNFLPKSYILI
jgi:hypothetical protein